MIERECSFNVGEKKFTAKFPNVGQLIDLESLKQALTSNRYGVMASSGVSSMYYVLDMVDAIAFYQVCAPSVGKYYNIQNYASLEPEKLQDLMDAYFKDIKPWFDKSMTELKKIGSNDNNETSTENSAKGES